MNFLRRLFGKKVRIVTHDGRFHADDVFAVAALQIYFDQKSQSIKIIRSRNPEVIATGDIVVDNGRTYDPAKKIFDHHQEGGAGKRENGVPYAAFGLIWKHYGEEIVGLPAVAKLIDEKLVQSIDFVDADPRFANIQGDGFNHYMIDDLVKAFGPTRYEQKPGDEANIKFFLDAVKIAKRVISREIIFAKLAVSDMNKVEQVYQNTADKRIIVLDDPLSWSHVLCSKPEPLYVVHPKYGTDWAVRAVPVKPGAYENRKRLPVEWGGKTEHELEALTGIKGFDFCHKAGWLANIRTKEGAIDIAKKAVAVDSTS